MPTSAQPATMVFWPGPCPCTSADGLSTRKYSAGRRKWLPSSKLISSTFSARFRRNSSGRRVSSEGTGASSRLRQSFGLFLLAQRRFGQRTDENFEQSRIDLTGPFHGRLSSVARTVGAVARQGRRRHLDDGGKQAAPFLKARRLEQGLFFARRERADHGDRGNEPLARGAHDRLPVGGDPMLLEERAQAPDQALAVETLADLAFEVAPEFAPIRHDAAVAFVERQFLADAKTRDSGQGDQVTAVLGLGEGGDAAGAADRIERRVRLAQHRIERLDHPDQPVAGDGVAGHREIARLENVERQPSAR